MTEPSETTAERRARLMAELAEREVGERREAFHAELGQYVRVTNLKECHRQMFDELFGAVEKNLDGFVAAVRGSSFTSRREVVIAARLWWRSLREREADRHAAMAAQMPEFEKREDGW